MATAVSKQAQSRPSRPCLMPSLKSVSAVTAARQAAAELSGQVLDGSTDSFGDSMGSSALWGKNKSHNRKFRDLRLVGIDFQHKCVQGAIS